MENMKLELIGRDYFDPQAAILLKQYKLELWPGYVTSIRQVPPCLLICSALIVRTLGRWPLGRRPVAVGSHPVWLVPPRSV